jgi:hypothetical protein
MTKVQFGVLVGLLAVLVLIELAPIVVPDRTSPKWDYQVEGIEDDKFRSEMNAFGAAGWELVFARRAVDTSKDGKAGYEVIFKRPR